MFRSFRSWKYCSIFCNPHSHLLTANNGRVRKRSENYTNTHKGKSGSYSKGRVHYLSAMMGKTYAFRVEKRPEFWDFSGMVAGAAVSFIPLPPKCRSKCVGTDQIEKCRMQRPEGRHVRRFSICCCRLSHK